MPVDDFVERVRDDNQTALSRLGSSKALYADTGGEMEEASVLRAAAVAERAAHETFASWADDAAAAAADAFRETAEEERDHYERVLGELDDDDVAVEELPAVQAYLRGLDDDVERAGGFLGRTLAAEKSKEQLVGFFVGQADPQTSQLFRDLGADLDDQLERAVSLLESLCEDDEDRERALTAASEAIEAAYDEYTERLEGMGVNPKPVC
jgi:rubrerythrin